MTNPISARLRDRKDSEILGGEMQSDGFGNGQPPSAAVEIMNEVVLATLISSRDTCAEMRELLDGSKGADHRTDLEMGDWTTLVLDIAALNRVIDYYGG